MATRTRTSFQKRQKELARVEKQRDKAAKRAQRKLEGPAPQETDEMLLDALNADDGEPGDDEHGDGEPSANSGPSSHEESR